jgi:hypothetical protein
LAIVQYLLLLLTATAYLPLLTATALVSGQNIFHHFTMYIGEAVAATLVFEGQALVV